MSMTVTIKKNKLLTKLHANREQHRSDFEKAMKGWRKEVAKEARKVYVEAEEGTLERMGGDNGREHALPAAIHDEPDNHSSEYKTVIEMFEMCEDDTITLSQGQFRCYIQDQWDWKHHWTLSNTKYL